jgi:hypothetical protein
VERVRVADVERHCLVAVAPWPSERKVEIATTNVKPKLVLTCIRRAISNYEATSERYGNYEREQEHDHGRIPQTARYSRANRSTSTRS